MPPAARRHNTQAIISAGQSVTAASGIDATSCSSTQATTLMSPVPAVDAAASGRDDDEQRVTSATETVVAGIDLLHWISKGVITLAKVHVCEICQ